MIYIFYLDYVPENKKEQMHGGNVYAKRIMGQFIKRKIEFTILLPQGYKAIDAEEEEIFLSAGVSVKEIQNLKQAVLLKKRSILFFPLLKGRYMYLLEDYKKKNPNLQVYITIHGLRLLDLKYDPMDRFYCKGIKFIFYPFIVPLLNPLKMFVYQKVMNKYLAYADKVFTVSNYSFKQIVSCTTPQYIKQYYCGTNLETVARKKEEVDRKYILFVNAGRSEKNFLRSLEAFIRFKKETSNEYYFYVVGLNKDKVNCFKRSPIWEEKIIKRWVILFDFLDSEQLAGLYANSNFVLYPSKSEGFGLPAVEACFNGVPLVASYGSAIPEVLESSAYYVDPYDVESIVKGMIYMTDEGKREKYAEKICRYQEIVKRRIAHSDENFVEEFSMEEGKK